MEDKDIWYSGIEPVDVGNLDDIKETKTVIPATKNVMFKIRKAEAKINKENTYRSINLELQITKGIDEEGKYKGKVCFARVCYFADPTQYTKDFFKTRQHLVELKKLIKATGVEYQGRVDGHFLDKLMESGEIKADITVKKRKLLIDDGTGNKVEEEIMDNEVRNFKAVDPSELI